MSSESTSATGSLVPGAVAGPVAGPAAGPPAAPSRTALVPPQLLQRMRSTVSSAPSSRPDVTNAPVTSRPVSYAAPPSFGGMTGSNAVPLAPRPAQGSVGMQGFRGAGPSVPSGMNQMSSMPMSASIPAPVSSMSRPAGPPTSSVGSSASGTAGMGSSAPSGVAATRTGVGASRVPLKRKAAGEEWVDPKLAEWDPNDFTIFVGDIGSEVNDDTLSKVSSSSLFP